MDMKNFKAFLMLTVLAVFLVACSNSGDDKNKETEESKDKEDATEEVTTVEVKDAHGTVTVPVNPKKVVALDNRTFETLADWNIELAAVPKAVMPADSPYVADEKVVDIGNHREPKLEEIAAVDPELVIVGQRFGSYYEDIKKLVPNAAVIDLSFDVSEEAATPGENLVNGLKDATTMLGKIFDKNEEAEKLIADFDETIASAKEAYNGEDTVMGVIVSGGDIGFSAPNHGRVWGPMFDIFGWVPALEVKNTSADHQGDEVSVEAIAQSNPDWIFVLDRDAAVSSVEDAVPAKDVIENSPALQNTTAITEKHVLYAPADTYTNESLQTFMKIFQNMADSLGK